ncbi:transmembrane protein, putative [Medicago truncatula]|uniref:Transmembrane protein, putative n=1 Tax=Medicago truncatula TaxID=3880 RepID=G7K5J3_MEDTR|nr:transmembrane protein, putative [Medicago truncatula]
MERRNTRKFTFRKLDLENLKKLAFEVTNLENFCDRHGKLLGVLWTNIEKGCLETLVQFYDPAYHCFTFPDYQLMPTLEEYSHLIGLPVLDKVPFTGLEPFPKAATIANALHLKTSLIKEKLTLKGNLPSLPTKFLYQQAFNFSKTNNVEAFYSILALLIYGLVLFPNIDNYVDIHAIQIFLTKNPVPTLLADIYHSIHDRTQVGRGAILGCAPLLYKWFTSHLPQTHSFQANPENLSWPKRIMSLTPSDITWYRATCNFTNIIVSCGEYSNVPLLGTQGGISYNPILAKRQFGCPMEAKPDNIYLQGEFYFNHEDPSNKRGRFVQAWHAIRTLNRSQLARRSDSLQGSYTQWVINRASDLVLPYHLPRYLSSTTPAPALPLAPATVEECQERLAQSECVGATWKRKYDEAMLKMETMSGEIEQQEHEVHKLRRQIVKKNVQIRAQSTRLSQFISAGERWEFFKDAHSDSDE